MSEYKQLAFPSNAIGVTGTAVSSRMPADQAETANLASFRFIVGRHVDASTIERARKCALAWNVAPHDVLLSQGWISPEDYTNGLAQFLGVGSVFAQTAPRRHAMRRNVVKLDATCAHPLHIAERVCRERARGRAIMLYSGLRPEFEDSPAQRRARAIHAISSLHIAAPIASAREPHPIWQKILATTLIGALIGVTAVDPHMAYVCLATTTTVLFALIVGLRIVTLATHIVCRNPRMRIPAALAVSTELPVYSVLVPLYDEAEILPDLIAALAELDYPAAKLDVVLILEDADPKTRRAAAAIRLPSFMRVVCVPDMRPRTKPKALNYALNYARGDFVVVYDAEDAPEPKQLYRALKVFSENPHVDCLQARLNIYNSRASWLTRQFALEYTVLFDGLLPALERLNVPIPLGGTSNHFRRETLEQVGGWDPFNVTEDADLGIRLCRHGSTIGILKSTTWEEAPETLANWLPQRTRWIKGWMQTYLVHMRRPAELYRNLGPWSFFTFQVLIGGFLLSVLLHPFLYAVIAFELTQDKPFEPGPSILEQTVWWAALFNLTAGYKTAMTLAFFTTLRRGRMLLTASIPSMPIYWLLSSVAAYRAAYQVYAAPHHWEKTRHARRTTPPAR